MEERGESDVVQSALAVVEDGKGTLPVLELLFGRIPPVAPVAEMIESASASLVQETNCGEEGRVSAQ